MVCKWRTLGIECRGSCLLFKEIEGIIVDEQCQDCIVSQTVPYLLSYPAHQFFQVFSIFFIPFSLCEHKYCLGGAPP